MNTVWETWIRLTVLGYTIRSTQYNIMYFKTTDSHL